MDPGAKPRPLMTLREALVQVALITTGVLVALGFDEVNGWRQHAALVREARANLTSEIRDNRETLSGTLKELASSQKQIVSAVGLLEKIVEKKMPEERSVAFSAPTNGLTDASHRTAEITGAFGFMPYDEVKTYAALYAFQNQVLAAQQQFVADITRTISYVPVFAEPERATATDFEDTRRQLRQTYSASETHRQLGEQLLREYDRILSAK